MVEKVIFLDRIFEMEILMDLHFMRSENHIYSSWSLCVSVISTQTLITGETSNFVFYIFIQYRCSLKLFIKIEQKLCVQEHTKNSNTLRPMEEISCY